MWNKFDKTIEPSSHEIEEFVNNPVYNKFCLEIEHKYEVKPKYEYSRCSYPGWNIQYKKSGKSLCRIYPQEGYFIVLIVVGKQEKELVEKQLPNYSKYLQDLYSKTKEGMDQRWLMIEVEDEFILKDIFDLISIRMKK